MLEEEVRIALGSFSTLKRKICEEERGPVDLQPILHMRGLDGDLHVANLLGHPANSMPGAWGELVRKIRRPGIVVVAMEAYCSDSLEGYERGRFERDFKENPSSNVSEIVTAQGIDIVTGRQFGGFVKFVIGDDGIPVFGRPQFAHVEGEALLCAIPSSLARLRAVTARGFFCPEIN